MAFFSKLKERLFKSSSKLEQGLDAIVEEGAESGAAEAVEAQAPANPGEDPPAKPDGGNAGDRRPPQTLKERAGYA